MNNRDELLIVAATTILLEGVAVALFIATFYVWLAIYATGGQ